MTSRDDVRELVRWVTARRGEDKQSLMRAMGAPDVQTAIMALFIVAVERRLGEHPEPEAVTAFVERARTTYLNADELPAALAESVIRGMSGEEGLLTGVTDSEMRRVGMGISYSVVRDLGLTGEALDDLLAEAVELFENGRAT